MLDAENKPFDCSEDSGIDNTNDIGTFASQPPVTLVHYVGDKITPFVNGKAIFDRAQAVGI